MFKALFKIVAGIVGMAVVLLLLLTLTFHYLWSPNQFKPQIEEWVLQKTGRELVIEGDLKVSLLPWLGLETGRLAVKNPTGFATPYLAEIEHSQLHVKLAPLLQKKLELARVVVQGFKIQLATNRFGEKNWRMRQPVPVKTAVSEPVAANPWLATLNVAGLALSEGEVIWHDQPNNRHIIVSDLVLNTGPWQPGSKTPIELSAQWQDVSLAQALPVALTTEFWVDEAFQHYQLAPFALSGQGLQQQPYALRTQIHFDLPKQQLKLAELFLDFAPLQMAGEIQVARLLTEPALSGQLSTPTFNLAQALQQWGVAMPLLSASDSLSQFSARLEFQADSTGIELPSIQLSVDQSQLTGTLKLVNSAQPKLTFNAAINQLDIARYLPAETPVDSATSQIAKPWLAGLHRQYMPLKPARWLRTAAQRHLPTPNLAVEGLIEIADVRFKQIQGQGLTLNLEGQDGSYRSAHSLARFYQGQAAGQAAIDLRRADRPIKVQETLNNVQIEPLLQAATGNALVDGMFGAMLEFDAHGESGDQYLANMNGKFNFALQDSVIKGINFQQMIDHVKSLIDGKTSPPTHPDQQTVFKTITGSGPIKQGVWHNPDLAGDASRMKITGAGLVDLIQQRLNYQLEGRLQAKSGDSEDVKKASQIPLLLNVEGPWQKPEIKLDLARMAVAAKQGELKQKADKLLDKLEQKVGPGAGQLLKKLF
ncbi:MAG: AsmA family protein [Methylococcales bacterium]|nr:AsmA family protein [Methylococcales bacterium]